jgi:uncharacterized protein (TIGR02271 family)
MTTGEDQERTAAPSELPTTADQRPPERRKEEVAVVPLVEEQLVVERRQRETGRVRIATHVRERTETVDEPVVREQVEVERVPINRVIDAAPPTREEGDYLIIPVVEEQIVVEKRLVLKEEIRVRKARVTERHREDVVLRSEDAEVVRVGGDTEAFEP